MEKKRCTGWWLEMVNCWKNRSRLERVDGLLRDEEMIWTRWDVKWCIFLSLILFLTAAIERAPIVPNHLFDLHIGGVSRAVTACARVSMRFDSSVQIRRNDIIMDLVTACPICQSKHTLHPDRLVARWGVERPDVGSFTCRAQDRMNCCLYFFLFWREKRDNAHAGPSYIFNGMIMGDCCNRWLPIFSARWTLSNRFLFLFSSRFVFFIFACCYRSLQNKSRSHRLRLGVESHGIYRIPSPYREPIFELNAKKNWIKKSFFSNYYLYQYKAQRHSPCKGWKKTNKTIGDFLIHLLDSTRLKVSLCFVSTRPNFFSPPTS